MNGFFSFSGITGTLEAKDYSAVQEVFHFVSAVLDRSMGWFDKPVLTLLHTIYSDVLNLLLFNDHGPQQHDQLVSTFCEKIELLKGKPKTAFGDLKEIIQFTEKVHMLCHVVETFTRYDDLKPIDPFANERSNCITKMCIRMTSVRKASIRAVEAGLASEVPCCDVKIIPVGRR